MAVASRRLRAREPDTNPLVAKLEAARWAVRELGRYTVPAPEVRIGVEDAAHILVLRDCQVARVRAGMIELSMYNVRWVEGELPVTGVDVEACLRPSSDLVAPQWEHPGDYQLLKGGEVSAKEVVSEDRVACVAYFDGGAAQRLGTAGFAVYGLDGEWLVGAALWFGKLWTTNNEAEAQGLLHLMQHVEQVGLPAGTQYLVVYGDSRLVIDFANRVCRPGKAELYVAMKRVAAIRRRLRCKVLFRHVERAKNSIADWLSNVAR